MKNTDKNLNINNIEALWSLNSNLQLLTKLNLLNDKVDFLYVTDMFRKYIGEENLDNMKWTSGFNKYIYSKSIENDKKTLRPLSELDFIQSRLSNNAYFSNDFRIMINDAEYYYRLKFTRDESDKDSTYIGISSITKEESLLQNYYGIGRKILIAEDNELNREMLCAILEDDYDVIAVENGEEAIDILKEQIEDIALIITDLEMSVMDGYELLRNLRKNPEYSNTPVIVATASDDEEAEIMCLELGASDFIRKPYNNKVVLQRVRNLISLRESTATLNVVEKDQLTGAYTKEFFYRYAQNILDSNPDKHYLIAVSDIVNFKMINEQYGKEQSDSLLQYELGCGNGSGRGNTITGRLEGSVLASITQLNEKSLEHSIKVIEDIIENSPIPSMRLKSGYYITDLERDITIEQMCDRAMLALDSIRESYDEDAVVYDEKMGKTLMMQQQIQDEMENAIAEKQFKVFYQPKWNIREDEPGGAEALVRWISPKFGFMSPGLFIPLFERNGFVRVVDEYILNEVCIHLSKWIEEGRKVVPISVNLSRKDFVDDKLTEKIINMVDSYNIPRDLIHLEITESSLSSSDDILERSIKELHDSGFKIELDDFGSGYSSLSSLNQFELDVMKIDKSIMSSDNPGSDKSALAFAYQLAKIMNLKTVQEGVETTEEVDRAASLGCDYIQGYYFSKPLSQEDFEEYMLKNTKQ
ncbi:MAG: EAL domain-containing protein [Erysipelotrichaceae bacterium]|nr:EAL domain-containing protein [Erysipelotrichaceae bacterium]